LHAINSQSHTITDIQQRCSSHSPGPTMPSAPSAAWLQLSGTRYPGQCSIVSLCQLLNLSWRRSYFLTYFHTTNLLWHTHARTHTHTHTRLTALFPGLPGKAGTRKVKSIWILLRQETVSDSGISWAICKSAPRSRQTTMPAPHHSVFTGRMPFLPPNQQRQSTEGKKALYKCDYN